VCMSVCVCSECGTSFLFCSCPYIVPTLACTPALARARTLTIAQYLPLLHPHLMPLPQPKHTSLPLIYTLSPCAIPHVASVLVLTLLLPMHPPLPLQLASLASPSTTVPRAHRSRIFPLLCSCSFVHSSSLSLFLPLY
jgi:hypothetical protein